MYRILNPALFARSLHFAVLTQAKYFLESRLLPGSFERICNPVRGCWYCFSHRIWLPMGFVGLHNNQSTFVRIGLARSGGVEEVAYDRTGRLSTGTAALSLSPPKVACNIHPQRGAKQASPYYPQCHTLRQATSGSSSRHYCSRPDRLQYAPLLPHSRTRLDLTTPTDTHNLQIRRSETHRLQDQEAREILGKASRQTRRHITDVITTATIAEPRRAHHHIHTQDLRPRVRDMSAVRDQ
jgi:hypothetical protein